MEPSSNSLAAAVACQRAGNFLHAEPLFRQVVQEDPSNVEGWYRLGEVCETLGRSAEAEDAFRQVLRLEPDNFKAHNNLGVVLLGRNLFAKARASFEEAIARRPDYPDALSNRGITLMAMGELVYAEQSFRQAIHFRADHFEAWNNLGMTLARLGRTSEALASYRDALRIKPDFVPAHANLASALAALDNHAEAAEAFAATLRLRPDDPELHNNLGALLLHQGQQLFAMEHFREAVRLRPEFAEAHLNLGSILVDLGHPAEAIANFDQALRLRPEDPRGFFHRGIALALLGKRDEALACTRQALQLRPNYPDALNNLGNVLREQGRIDEAVEYYRRALTLDRGNSIVFSNLLFALQYYPNLSPEFIWEEHRRFGTAQESDRPSAAMPPIAGPADRRLLVGYVSPDFRNHVVGGLAELIVTNHNRQRFEVICYADVPKPDAVTQRIRAAAARFINLSGKSTDAAVEQIRADGVDILIDLAGHTAGNRLPVFARRAAPVQATLYGYPGTTGLSTMDYRIADSFLDPPGLTEGFYSERMIRLPQVYWCYGGGPDFEPGSLPVKRVEHITFGSLNNPTKITRDRVRLWAEIMLEVPRSRMIIMAAGGTEGLEWLRNTFALHGIEARRLTLVARRSREDYFLLHREIDVCLDTFPYTGCNTTLDALWMGVPVVTQADRWTVTRQGVPPLTVTGLQDLITDSPEAYIATAIRLAGNISKLATLRKELRGRLKRSPMMDAVAYTRNLEKIYLQIWSETLARAAALVNAGSETNSLAQETQVNG